MSKTTLLATPEAMVALCRCAPLSTKARVRINGGEWGWLSGGELVELWDQSFAGTFEIDGVYLDGERRLVNVGESGGTS